MLLNMMKGEMGVRTETPLSQDEQCSHIPELPQVSPWSPEMALQMPWGLQKLWIANESANLKINLSAEKILLNFQCIPDT